MKRLLAVSLLLCCFALPVLAEESETKEQKQNVVDLEDLAKRMNTIKAEDYTKMVAPSHIYAHKTAKNLTDKEAKKLVNAKNHIDRRLARKNKEKEPSPIVINTKDKRAVEKFLTPDLYTYDDLPQ